MPLMSENAIKVSELVKKFGNVTAVHDVTFSVARGSIVALLGGNGAGKTTTLSMLVGLLEPTGGQVHVLGHSMPAERHKALPFMNFSSPYVDLPHRLTVLENLTVYGHLYGLRQVRRRIDDLVQQLELQDFLKRSVGSLSAGQKTRVALAKALLNEPELLILDEPTASLDPDTADWVRAWLQHYCAASGATMLLASHHMGEVERLCSHILMMKQGRIVDQGSPAALLARYGRDNLEDVFLDIARSRRQVPEVAAE